MTKSIKTGTGAQPAHILGAALALGLTLGMVVTDSVAAADSDHVVIKQNGATTVKTGGDTQKLKGSEFLKLDSARTHKDTTTIKLQGTDTVKTQKTIKLQGQ